jgi:hypothetical protein
MKELSWLSHLTPRAKYWIEVSHNEQGYTARMFEGYMQAYTHRYTTAHKLTKLSAVEACKAACADIPRGATISVHEVE